VPVQVPRVQERDIPPYRCQRAGRAAGMAFRLHEVPTHSVLACR